MKLKKYSKYKNSGIDWIGEIPEDWQVDKMKFLLDVPVTDGPHETPEFIDEGIPFLSVDSIQKGEIIFDNTRKISISDYKKYKLKCNPQKNDLFMGKAASIGKIARVKVDFPFSIWSPLALLRVNKKMTPFFFEYALKSDYIQNQIEILSTSNTQKNISMGDIPRIILVTPPLKIQNKISSFLDSKTSQIENLIEKDNNLIELLKERRVSLINKAVTKGLDDNVKMKDSGVEWIGEIPESWEVRKLKGLVKGKSQYGAGCEPSDTKEDVIYIRITDIGDNGYLRDTERVYLSKEDARQYYLDKGDVLFARSGATVGKTYYHTLDNNKDYCYAGYLIRYKADKVNLIGKYLFYFTLSKSYTEWIKSVSIQATIENVSADKYNELFLSIGNIDEQQKIVEFLDKETSKIDNHIKKVERRIELYEEYKKSLIYNVVTGKVEV